MYANLLSIWIAKPQMKQFKLFFELIFLFDVNPPVPQEEKKGQLIIRLRGK
jgi:hypothetical protein